jgi:2-polyprenyl-3-methyl-5-hydroxy-6-metoxy-1,4-benzoquinol methylase
MLLLTNQSVSSPATELETVDCILCHYAENKKKFVRFGYQIVECPNCMLWWVNPRASQSSVNKVYTGEYFEVRKVQKQKSQDGNDSFKRQNCERHPAEIERHHKTGKLLDLGCAEGLFLRVAQQKGWDVSGVEVSPQAADIAKTFLPGKVFQGRLEDVPFPENDFDVITMFDVVEHLYDPVDALKKIWRLLKPDGIVYLLTPDCGSIYAKVMGKYWFEVKPKEHIYYFSEGTLRLLFEKSGFMPLSMEKAGKVLTFEYISTILRKENPFFAGLLRGLTKWTPFYNKNIAFPSGFIVGIGIKK